jgi:hypothetical protein
VSIWRSELKMTPHCTATPRAGGTLRLRRRVTAWREDDSLGGGGRCIDAGGVQLWRAKLTASVFGSVSAG